MTLLSNPIKAEKMGQEGLADIQIRFHWCHMTSKWQQVFAHGLDIAVTVKATETLA
ncbi:MAG: hypothetical protein V7L11_21530 [Nostoc sp.]|uniref:hypothetical protein n=1 Tax=Nostoc sp. TaxID=1180 RepID=UPI002FFA9C6B